MNFFEPWRNPPVWDEPYAPRRSQLDSSSHYVRRIAHMAAQRAGLFDSLDWDVDWADPEIEWDEFIRDKSFTPEKNYVPFLHSFDPAAAWIVSILREKRNLMIYGDFDCDGMSATVIMYEFLKSIAPEHLGISLFIPDRKIDGYGLTKGALERAINDGRPRPDLIVAVDCSTNSVEEIEWLLDTLHIHTVVIDHHDVHVGGTKNRAQAVVNPKAECCPPEVKQDLCDMSAAGLVFGFCEGLSRRLGIRNWQRDRALLFAGVATYVDVMPVLRTNRLLIREAIRLANANLARLSPGLFALEQELNTFNKFRPIDEETFGMRWGPCINASGRIGNPMVSVNLLLAQDPQNAAELAKQANKKNEERQGIGATILLEAKHQALAQVDDPQPAKIILVTGDWDLGVVGIVAARLREMFGRPAIVCGKDEAASKEKGEIVWRGSGRSVAQSEFSEGFDLGSAFLEARAKGLILKGGGHFMAGGLSVAESQRADFHQWLNDRCSLAAGELIERVSIPAYAPELDIVEWETLYLALRPFGNGNPAFPIIAVNGRLTHARTVRVRTDDETGSVQDINAVMPHHGYKLIDFVERDIRDSKRFLAELNQKQFSWLRKFFPIEARRPQATKEEICKALNSIVRGRLLYEELQDVVFRSENVEAARKLIDSSVEKGREVARLNRFLLEDAFPGILRHGPEFKPLKVEARFSFDALPQYELKADWYSTARARRELRIGQLYTLKLKLNYRRMGARFDILDCWMEGADAPDDTFSCRIAGVHPDGEDYVIIEVLEEWDRMRTAEKEQEGANGLREAPIIVSEQKMTAGTRE